MYEITIKEIKTVDGEKGGDWVTLEKAADGKETKGYSPIVQCKKEVQVERFRQTVDSLDLVAVIKAVNGLKGDS